MFGKGWLIVGLASLATLGSATVSATRAYASDASGNPIQPQLGVDFYTTVDLASDSAADDSVSIAFSAASGNRATPVFNILGTGRAVWGPFRLLMDAPMTITVKLNETGATSSYTVSPVEPTSIVEAFNPQEHTATYSASWDNGIAATNVRWWIPVAPTTPFQQIADFDAPGLKTPAARGGQVVSVFATSLTQVDANVKFSASAVRSNFALLNSVSFRTLDLSAKAMKPWLLSETLMPTTNREIANFVSLALGKNYRTTMNPATAARKLYLATIARLTYVPTAYVPDAIQALHRGNGDCGSFSSVFVTACRNAGIPARPACGFVLGDDQWHIWAEFWLPGAGWVPVDPTYADGLRPSGDTALYFGVIPDLNQRLVTSYGFDRTVGKDKIVELQSPAAFLTNAKAGGKVTDHCSLR
jgi:transglutaminase-like putative cysteine protease